VISPDNNAMNRGESMEPEATPVQMRVRQALQTLPKATCPVGFDFRLERRLAGKPVGGTRSGWSMGWLGAGVGFGTAMVLALFVFDFGAIPGTSPANITGTPAPVMMGGTQIEQPLDVAKTTVTDPANSATLESEQLASTPDSMKDKTKPGTLPEGNYQTVGTSGGK